LDIDVLGVDESWVWSGVVDELASRMNECPWMPELSVTTHANEGSSFVDQRSCEGWLVELIDGAAGGVLSTLIE
jgi:hypothetical protein